MNLKQAAEGRWQGILAALGVPEEYRDPQRNGPCPFCKQGTDTYRFTDYMDRGCFVCHRGCGPGDGFKFVQLWLNCGYAEACREVERVMGIAQPVRQRRNGSAEAARKIWRKATPVQKGDPVYRYLRSRGLGTISGDLNIASVWDAASKRAWVSMVIPIISRANGSTAMAGLHVTHLDCDGGRWVKARINSPRKQYKFGATLAGAAIELAPVSALGRLAVAEGVETALAVRQMTGLRCWAVISTALMRKFKPPENVRELAVYGDNDANFAGQAAAYHLAHRLSQRDIEVSVAIPRERGWDWLDFLNARKGGGDG